MEETQVYRNESFHTLPGAINNFLKSKPFPYEVPFEEFVPLEEVKDDEFMIHVFQNAFPNEDSKLKVTKQPFKSNFDYNALEENELFGDPKYDGCDDDDDELIYVDHVVPIMVQCNSDVS